MKDPTCAVFFKSRGFEDIKYDIPMCQNKNTQLHQHTNTSTKCWKDNGTNDNRTKKNNNVIDQRQHNKRKRIQRQRMFAKKRRRKNHYNILDKKKLFYFQGSESDRPTCQGVLGLSFIYT